MKCCVCGEHSKGIIICGEFVCSRCHFEATGEHPPKMVEVKKGRQRTLPKRRQIRDNLITENLKNKIKEKCDEK